MPWLSSSQMPRMVLFFEAFMTILYNIIKERSRNMCENSNYSPPKNSTFCLRFSRGNAIMFMHCFSRCVMGFMSGGMVADSVSEGFCNYLNDDLNDLP